LVLVLLKREHVLFAVDEQVFARFQARQDRCSDPRKVPRVHFEREGLYLLPLRQEQLLLQDHLLLLLQVDEENFDAVDRVVELLFTHAQVDLVFEPFDEFVGFGAATDEDNLGG